MKIPIFICSVTDTHCRKLNQTTHIPLNGDLTDLVVFFINLIDNLSVKLLLYYYLEQELSILAIIYAKDLCFVSVFTFVRKNLTSVILQYIFLQLH